MVGGKLRGSIPWQGTQVQVRRQARMSAHNMKGEMMELTVTVWECDAEALADTLGLIAGQVRAGFTSGFDSNENGQYVYDVKARVTS